METELRPFVRKLQRAVQDRAGYFKMGMKQNHAAWQLTREGWITMRQCTVTLYAPGCVRFRNDASIDIPKKVWPFAPVSYAVFGKMEITVHADEVDELLPLLLEIAEDARKDYSHASFPNGIITPNYCWSVKATEHCQAQRATKGKGPR